jgi:TolA-binding protein
LHIRLTILGLLFLCHAQAQLSAEFLAMNSLTRGKWEKAKTQLTKALRKDSLNAGALYVYSRYYFTHDCPDFQIDSAYSYALKAQQVFAYLAVKQRERWRKLPMDSMQLVAHRQQIDSAAFKRAADLNTEAGYIYFISRFNEATQLARASQLRDEVAYINALKEGTYQSFDAYIKKYPNSSRANDAKVRYERLLFEAKTKDKKLSSYESFLVNYPITPHRAEAEQQIFQIMTASGEPSLFEKYLTRYPTSRNAKIARDILYHHAKEEDKPIPAIALTDSLRIIQQLENTYLVPFLKDGLFGFMNDRGEQIIKPKLTEIDEYYACGNIFDELIVQKDIVLARNNTILYRGTIDDYDGLGYGFLKILTGEGCVKVIHYSGFAIAEDVCLEDAKVLGHNFLALKSEGSWAVWSFTGLILLPFHWDELDQIGDLVVFIKAGKINLVSVSEIAQSADNEKVNFSKSFDEVKVWPDKRIWVKTGNKQYVLTQQLTPWIEEANHELTPTFFGAQKQSTEGFSFIGSVSSSKEIYRSVKISKPWIAGKAHIDWQLIDYRTLRASSLKYDSVSFIGPLAIGIFKDSLHIYFSSSSYLKTTLQSRFQFLPGKDSVFYFLLEEMDKRKVFDAAGTELFSVVADKIEYNNEGYFTIIKKEKHGLVDSYGKVLVVPEFEAIGPMQNGVISVLKDKRFGLINLNLKTQIKPEYGKNITPYSASALVAYKNGAYGFIGWNNKPITNFEFEEVLYWNDSTAWVKKNFNWRLYNFYARKIVLDKVKKFKWFENTEAEKILIFQQENNFGVISNKRGVIIQPNFSGIVNLGSPETPLYFTEKHVEEASIFVVIYYNDEGIQLLRQVYEEDEYDRIFCSKIGQ